MPQIGWKCAKPLALWSFVLWMLKRSSCNLDLQRLFAAVKLPVHSINVVVFSLTYLCWTPNTSLPPLVYPSKSLQPNNENNIPTQCRHTTHKSSVSWETYNSIFRKSWSFNSKPACLSCFYSPHCRPKSYCAHLNISFIVVCSTATPTTYRYDDTELPHDYHIGMPVMPQTMRPKSTFVMSHNDDSSWSTEKHSYANVWRWKFT